MKSYKIHLLRHGMTEENKKGIYIGSTDVPLSKEGIENLKQYDKEYKYPGTPLLFSSPMLRSVQSCNILYPDLKPVIVNDLRECSFGEWEGQSIKELGKKEEFIKWLADSIRSCPPGGESGAEFTKRVCLAFEKIVTQLLKSGETTAVIISHGGVITTLLSVYGLPHAKPYDWQMDNGFGFSMRIDPMLWMRDKVAEVYEKIPYII